jgi:signal transduction histidine kinase
MFTNEDINLLSTIAEQMSVALKNAQFYGNKVQTERLASIGMMSATFAHEIRNPLTSLKTFAQLMPEKYNDPEFRDTFSKIVVGEIEKIDTLISDLLDFSTEKKSARLNDFNLVELVDETLEYIKGKFNSQKKDIDVVKLYHENLIDMSGDATKLKQAFGIIITNAYQAMNGSGKLTVDIGMNNEGADVAVSDTGEGIPHEDLSRIFDPFVTTKEMGVGLGLAITKRVIEDHEGKIYVRSRMAEGTTFTVSLPVKI